MTSVAFIVPGYSFSTERECYQNIGNAFREKNVEPEYIDIEWSKNLNDNIEKVRSEINERLEDYEKPEIYLFGHSWGAVRCLCISPELKPEAQILAGMSPEFGEELELSQLSHRWIRRILETLIRVFTGHPGFSYEPPRLSELEDKKIGKLYFIYGSKEYDSWRSKIWGLNSKITEQRLEFFHNSKEILVSGSGHLIDDQYASRIRDIIQEL